MQRIGGLDTPGWEMAYSRVYQRLNELDWIATEGLDFPMSRGDLHFGGRDACVQAWAHLTCNSLLDSSILAFPWACGQLQYLPQIALEPKPLPFVMENAITAERHQRFQLIASSSLCGTSQSIDLLKSSLLPSRTLLQRRTSVYACAFSRDAELLEAMWPLLRAVVTSTNEPLSLKASAAAALLTASSLASSDFHLAEGLISQLDDFDATRELLRLLPTCKAEGADQILFDIASQAAGAPPGTELLAEAAFALSRSSVRDSVLLNSLVEKLISAPDAQAPYRPFAIPLIAIQGTKASSYSDLLLKLLCDPATQVGLRIAAASAMPHISNDPLLSERHLHALALDANVPVSVRLACASALATLGIRDSAIVSSFLRALQSSRHNDEFWWLLCALRRSIDTLLPSTGNSSVDEFLRLYLPIAFRSGYTLTCDAPNDIVNADWAREIVDDTAASMNSRLRRGADGYSQLRNDIATELWQVLHSPEEFAFDPAHFGRVPALIQTRLTTRAVNFLRRYEQGESHRTKERGTVYHETGHDITLQSAFSGTSPAVEVERADLVARLRDVILGLPELERKVILARFFQRRTLTETADELHLTFPKVRTLECKALASIRQSIRSYSPDDVGPSAV